MKLFAAVLLICGLAGQTSATIISSIERLDQGSEPWLHSGTDFQTFTPPFQVWRDYSFIYASTPEYLHRADQILTSFSVDRRDPDFQLQVTLAETAIVYLLIDDRVPNIATEMPWVAALGFTDTGDTALVDQFAGPLRFPFSIFRGTFPAGNIVLHAQNDTSANALTGMYTVGAAPIPEPAVGSISVIIAAAGIAQSSRLSRLRRSSVIN